VEHTDRSGHLKVLRSDENVKSAESCLIIKMCKYLRGGPVVRFRQIETFTAMLFTSLDFRTLFISDSSHRVKL